MSENERRAGNEMTAGDGAVMIGNTQQNIGHQTNHITINEAQPEKTYAAHIDTLKLPAEVAKNIFSFCNPKIKFRGRQTELAQLNAWLNEGFMSVRGVTGQGGSGKSRLALHFAQQVDTERKAVWLDKREQVEQLLAFNVFSYPKQVLFICDYASQYEDKLKDLIEKMCGAQANVKFLLLERSDAWYSSFVRNSDIINDHAYEESISLEKARLSDEEYGLIIQDIADARKEGKKIPKAAQKQIIAKAEALSETDRAVRCLFLMLTADAYLKDPDIQNLDADDLLHNYLDHSDKILKKHYQDDLISAGYHVLAYATACNGIRYSDIKEHPAVQNEWELIKEQLKDRTKINTFFLRLSEIDNTESVPAMKPDLIGEFLFLHKWNDFMDDQQSAWLAELLKQDYSRSFFAMCLADWPGKADALCKMLSDRDAEAKQRVACAKVFNLAVREARSLAECKDYAKRIRDLDQRQPAVLKEYTDAVWFIFNHAEKDTRAECAALLDDVNWEQYSHDTEEEQQHLAAAYSDAADVYDDMGLYDKALEYHEKALAIREKVFGTEHPDTAVSYNGIAVVYTKKGDYDKALEYYQKDLAISEKELGAEHPDTAKTYGNIGIVYKEMGDYDKALEYHEKALAVQEKVLGTEHPDTAKTYNNIANVYAKKGDYDKALEYYEKALAVKVKVLGTEHPSTAATYNNIANAYYSKGNYDKALEYAHKAEQIFESVLGFGHPNTQKAYRILAELYFKKDDTEKALEYIMKAEA